MPKITEQIQTIQQEATDSQKEHSRKEREEQLENIMALYDLMAEKDPDAEIDLQNVTFLRARFDLRNDGVLADLMKDMDDRQLLDAIKAPEDFRVTLNKDYDEKAAENRKEKQKQRYLDTKQKFVDKFDQNRSRLMEVFGPEGKMPTDVDIDQALIDEYDSIKLDVPEGMDKETAMCIILGCCFDPENLAKADPSLANASPHSIHFAQNNMVSDLLIGDKRPSPSPKAMIEGKKEAQRVFDAYKNNDKAPAIAKLNNLIIHENQTVWETFALSGGNIGGKLSPSKALDLLVPEIIEKNKDLGLDYNLQKPTNTPSIRCASLCKQLNAGKANEQAKIDLGKNFFNMQQAEKEEKTAEMLFNGYVSRMAYVQLNERDQIKNKHLEEVARSIGKRSLDPANKALGEECEKFRSNQANYSISDFDVIMSKPDGIDTLKELYMDKIKETDIYKKIVGAKNRDQLFEALEESDTAVDAGLTSFKDVKLPDASKEFNDNNKRKLEYATQKFRNNVIKIAYSEKSLCAEDVDNYGLNSLDPEALKKNSNIMDQIYDNIKKLSKGAPEQFNDFMRELKECRDKAKAYSELGRDICKREVGEYKALMDSAASKAEKYLSECRDDNPERIKTTAQMRGLLIAIPTRSTEVANKGIEKKRREVCGERFAVLNKYGIEAQKKVFLGEKYKDNVPASKQGFSSGRTGNLSMTIMAMAATGKYTLDDIIDPEKFVNEKQQMFDEVTKRLVRGEPEDQEWAAKVLHEGRKASEKLVDEKARQIDFSKADISDKEYCKLLQYGFYQFDAYQECSHCPDEIIRLANSDKTEEHPEFKNIEEYCVWTDGRLNALGNICEGYNYIQDKAGELMEEQIDTGDPARLLLTYASIVKYGEKTLAEDQKKNYNKPFHEWHDGHLNREMKFLVPKLSLEYSDMLRGLNNDPKTAHALLGKMMDGTLLEPQTVNGKTLEGSKFSVNKDTYAVTFTGKAPTRKDFKEIAFFAQPNDKMLGQSIKDINKAKESVLFGSTEYKNAGIAMTELEKAYKTMNELPANASEEQKLQAYASVKEKSAEARQKINLYFARKTSQNLMNGNADPKTQKRIDAMKHASGVAKILADEMKQKEEKLREDKLNARLAKDIERYEARMNQSREAYLGKVNEQLNTEKNFSLTAAKGAKDALGVLDRLSKNYGPLSDKEIETAKQSMAAVAYNDILQHDEAKRELARELQGSPEMYRTTLEKTLNSPVLQYMTKNLTRESLSNFTADPKRTIDNAIRAAVAENEKKTEIRNINRQPELAEEKKPEMKAGK